MPRMSEDISDHSLSVLIDAGSAEEQPKFFRQFAIDVAVGFALGIVSGLIAFSILQVLGIDMTESIAISAGE